MALPSSCISFIGYSYGMFEWRGKGGEVKESKVEMIKNKLILY